MITWNNSIKILLTSLFFIYLFTINLYPLYYDTDTDTYWHIKTGEVIFNERGIPEKDPFNFTPTDPVRERFLLSSYWLADLILYLFYKTGGLSGVVILRSLMICLTILFVHLSILKRGYILSIIFPLLLYEVIRFHPPKPALFSFLLISAMIFFMEKYRREGQNICGICIFMVMLLWANIHGTYIIGVALLIVYLVSAFITHLRSRREEAFLSVKSFRTMTFTATAGIFATFLTPSGISSYLVSANLYMDKTQQLMADKIIAHWSFLKYIKNIHDPSVVLVVFLILLILTFTLLNLKKKRAGVTDVLLIFSLLVMVFGAVRMAPYLLITGMIVSMGKEISNDTSVKSGNRVEFIFLFFLLLVVVVSFYVRFPARHFGKLSESLTTNVKISEFLLENRLKGNMLNQAPMGNLFILKLFPEYKVFHSTRHLNMNVYKDSYDMFNGKVNKDDNATQTYMNNFYFYMKILNKSVSGDFRNDYWYKLLDKYEIDFIVGRVTDPMSGSMYPLFLKLMYYDKWKPIYRDGNSVILVRDNEKNDEILKKRPTLDGLSIFSEIIQENRFIFTGSSQEALSFAFAMKGKFKEAKKLAESAYTLNNKSYLAKAVLMYIDTHNNEAGSIE